MFVEKSYQHHALLSERPELRSSVHIPMVYERVQEEPVQWEYHVLKVDPREYALPEVDQLNDLGKQGWVLVSVLDERMSGKGSFVYYYFTRQARD